MAPQTDSAWVEFEFRSTKRLASDEAVVIIRHVASNRDVRRMRWWLSKRHGTWKIFDMEDLDLGIRHSVRVASVIAQGFDKAQDVASDKLNEAMDALRVNRDADAADRLLQQVANEKLPKEWEAYRWLVVSQVQMQRNQWEEALKSCDRANEYRREFPILDLLRGICYNALGKGKEALKHLEAYRDLLGEDGLVCRNWERPCGRCSALRMRATPIAGRSISIPGTSTLSSACCVP